MPDITNYMMWIWLAVIAVAVFVESATTMLVSIWFALGALAALIADLLGADLASELEWFVRVSLAGFFVVRLLAGRYVNPKFVPTNADRLLGSLCRITEAVDNTVPSGAAYADGKTWTVRSADGECIPVGSMAEIVRMEGVKLIVRLHHDVSSEQL